MKPRSNPQTVETRISIAELIRTLNREMAEKSININNVLEQLNHFLLPHGITTKCCDIFEETLLKEAGVTTQPTECMFAPAGDKNGKMMGFQFGGISYDDLLKFVSYYNKQTSQQSDVEIQFNNEKNVGIIIVDVNIVYNKLLPAFKSAFPNISREKLDHYIDLSKQDDDVVDYDLLQSILILLNTTLDLTDNPLKAGMLTILNEQLKNAIDEYRVYQLHECESHVASLKALGYELGNFRRQSHRHSALSNDENVKQIDKLIEAYAELQMTKKLKAIFGEPDADNIVQEDALSAPDSASAASSSFTGSESNQSSHSDSTIEYSALNSDSNSDLSLSRSDSPLRSVSRLFATPSSTPSHSRSASTSSFTGSDVSSDIISPFNSDLDDDIQNASSAIRFV